MKSNSQICDELKFSSLQDYIFHLLTFHFKQDKEFRDNLVVTCNFNIAPEDWESSSNVRGTPKPKVNPNKNLYEQKLFSKQSIIQSDQSGTSQNKQTNIVVNSNNDSTQSSSAAKTTTANRPPSKQDDGDFECRNENHKEPMLFKTREHKEYHIIKSHKCVDQNCQYSNEFESELLKHFKAFHSKTKDICQLCGMGYNNEKEHYDSYHFDCTACKKWFATLNDLKAHETKCFSVVENDPIQRVVSTSFVNNTVEKESLMIDQTNTDNDFSKALLHLVGSSNLPEEIKQECEKSIKKQASESLITKSRLRAECFSDFKSQQLLFDLPIWNTNVSKDAVSKINTVLGVIKESDIFRASSKDSQKYAVANFECLEAAQDRISRTTTICSLTEAHGKILLSNFLSQSVKDELCGYNKTAELLNLSYRRILESLQFLYINIKLSVLESRIMSYRIQEGETIYQFSNRVLRHLSLCSKKLQLIQRAGYIENNLAKLLRGNVPPQVLAEINRKESVFSPYSSTEILDIYKNVMAKDDQHYDQYEVMFTQKDDSKLRGFKKSRDTQQNSRKQKYMTESSLNRFKELGLDPGGPQVCFLCLETNHVSRSCPTYQNTSLSSILCMVNGKPHGYHRHDQCKNSSTNYVTDDYE